MSKRTNAVTVSTTHIYTLLCRAVVANLISVYGVVRTQTFHVIRYTFLPDSKISKYMGESSQDYS